jgi:bifunctional non-homologous end joining protein LigD
MLGWWRDGTLVHAGNVGSGLSEKSVAALLAALEPARRPTAAFEVGADPLPRGAVFVEPQLVVEVRYTEVTERGMLRQPVLLGVRDDTAVRDATTCRALRGASEDAAEAAEPAPPTPHRHRPRHRRRVSRRATREDLLARRRLHQGDLLAFYDAIWPYVAPYRRDRPVVLTR